MRRVALALLAGGVAADMPRTLFNDTEVELYGARCLDGSPSGYYFEPGAQADSWVVFLEGGGGCETKAACAARTLVDLGTSKRWPKQHKEGMEWQDVGNLISSNATVNPDLWDWNHVFVPYCSGDLHTGTQREENDWGMYFAGHHTLAAVFDKLGVAEAARRVILTGDSAGGMGTWSQVDFVAEELLPEVESVVGVPQGGWFYPNNVSAFADWQQGVSAPVGVSNASLVLWDSYVNPACAAAWPTLEGCDSMGWAYQHVRAPLFVVQNAFDSNDIYSQLHAPRDGSDAEAAFVEYFGAAMMDSIAQVGAGSKAGDGLFLASCLAHVDNLNLASPTRVQGLSFGDVFHNWYFQTGGPTVVADEVTGLPDNPTCNNLSG